MQESITVITIFKFIIATTIITVTKFATFIIMAFTIQE